MRGNPQQIALVLRRKAQALERAVRDAEAASAKELLAHARSLSTGGHDAAALRRRGHPLRIGGPGLALPIGLGRGEFYLGWRVIGPRKSGDGLKTSLVNESDVAAFILKGTRKMQARPVTERLRAKISALRLKRHRAALAAIHRGG